MDHMTRPVLLIFKITTEHDVTVVLLCFRGNFGQLRPVQRECQFIVLLFGPLAEARDRELMKDQQITRRPTALGNINAFQKVIEIAPYIGTGISAVHTADSCLNSAHENHVAPQIGDRICTVFPHHRFCHCCRLAID